MGHYIHIVVFLTVSRGKTADQAVEKFLRKTRELDSYGAIFNIVQVHMHLRVYRGSFPHDLCFYKDFPHTYK